ncbi:flagellin [Paracoccus litorisediminis]|uniref:Flagellar hook protein n=1 Tax=Paracoccus litorisediminis TaxID=2006130 RepID=A0A844HGY4_9RHOB|nr:flagellin [Paracoccus litorisediminis]MTH59056.1 flagellar hook protein [Paracoccus litorisediminis]
MTQFNSISDLARSYQLRLSQTAIKSRLSAISQEATTGIKSDIPQALRGDLNRISQIENRLTTLKDYSNNLSEAQGVLSAMQTALGSIQSIVSETGTVLMSDAIVASPATLGVYLDKAPADLKTALNALNTSVGGRFVFSGSRTDQPAMVSYDDLLSDLTTAIGGATSVSGVIAAIDTFFDAPAGGGGFSDQAFTGNDQGNFSIAISPGRNVEPKITGNSTELRTVLKGLATMAYLAQNDTLDHETRREISRQAGRMMVEGEMQMTSARTVLGVQQEAAAKAQTTNEAEGSALALARNTLIAADPYEAATAMSELESNLETLYAVTARLSKLSLTDYL